MTLYKCFFFFFFFFFLWGVKKKKKKNNCIKPLFKGLRNIYFFLFFFFFFFFFFWGGGQTKTKQKNLVKYLKKLCIAALKNMSCVHLLGTHLNSINHFTQIEDVFFQG